MDLWPGTLERPVKAVAPRISSLQPFEASFWGWASRYATLRRVKVNVKYSFHMLRQWLLNNKTSQSWLQWALSSHSWYTSTLHYTIKLHYICSGELFKWLSRSARRQRIFPQSFPAQRELTWLTRRYSYIIIMQRVSAAPWNDAHHTDTCTLHRHAANHP